MRLRSVLMCLLLSMALVAPAALAHEAELADWARARWSSYAVEAPDVLAGALHPDGGTVFMGTPWDGFYYGGASEDVWAALLGWMAPDAVEMEIVRVLVAGNLVWGEITLAGTEREHGAPVELNLASALVFDAEGRILAEDLIVLEGMPSDTPAPRWDAPLAEGAYAHHLNEGSTGMDLWWRNGLAVLLVGVRAPGTGWVSVGFDPERRMQGADFVIGAVTEGGVKVEDHHGHLPTGHRRDDHEDILAAVGQIEDGVVTLQFVIPLVSGDPDDNPLTPGETHDVLLAYHRSSTAFTVRHTARGAASITLDE